MVVNVGGCSAIIQNGKFSIKKMYNQLRVTYTKVPWRRVFCRNKASPKALFITWLAAWNKLLTRDKLLVWKMVTNNICSLCGAAPESVEHLFFVCAYAKGIWSKVLDIIQFRRPVAGFKSKLEWAVKCERKHQLYLMLFAESVYHIWIERNSKIFKEKVRTPAAVFRDILFKVAVRANADQQRMLMV
ncbi:hypothetical protein POM88_013909 [Heracleum sosnowskyi]|uniref:Reverse transcriptase zinc-binding domain-containing protein n=1 Tax=Heracleum sosnowskyi TaxID=360622 RepID=A0AAD8J0S5_9APIA|nr:hypothetical protein POM88_013909 [Heracleum sosnowskyi]